MATVRMPDGREFEVPDGDVMTLDYYRGEGAVVLVADQAAAAAYPQVFDGDKYVEASPEHGEVESFVAASTVAEVLDRVAAEPEIAGQVLAAEQSRGGDARVTLLEALQGQVEQEHPGFGEPMHGVEAPADGTPVEISSDDS